MRRFAIAWVGALVVFLALDSVWLTLMNGALYRPVMGDMLLDGFRPVPAVLFYLIYIAALVYFGSRPNEEQPLSKTIRDAAIFGFAAYATYDLTNQATLKNWSTALTISDLIWGTFVSTVGATAGRLISRRF